MPHETIYKFNNARIGSNPRGLVIPSGAIGGEMGELVIA